MRMIRMMKSSSTSSSSTSSQVVSTKPSSSPTTNNNTTTNQNNNTNNNTNVPIMSHHHTNPTKLKQRYSSTQDVPDVVAEDDMVEVSWDAIAQPSTKPRRNMITTTSQSHRRRIISSNSSNHSNVIARSNPTRPAASGEERSTSSCLPIRVGNYQHHQHHQGTHIIPIAPQSHHCDTVAATRTKSEGTTVTAARRTAPPPSMSSSSHSRNSVVADVIRPTWSEDVDDNASSEYVDWPGTQDAYGQTIPMMVHDDDDDNVDWTPPLVPSSFKKTTHDPNRTMNTSATTAESSFHSLALPDEEDHPMSIPPETDFFFGAQLADQQTKLQYDPSLQLSLLQQPIPLKRSVDSISVKSSHHKSLSFHPSTAAPKSTNDSTNQDYMKGYRGFIEKTKDVPSLFDTTADSASEATTATPSPTKLPSQRHATNARSDYHHDHDDNNNNNYSKNPYSTYDTETYVSDVFDGLSLFSNGDDDAASAVKSLSLQQYHQKDKLAHVPRVTYPQSIIEEGGNDDDNDMNHFVRDNYHPNHSAPSNSGSNSHTTFQLITLPGMGITTIQTTDTDYQNRYTAHGSTASNSDIGSYHTNSTTMTPIPNVQKMLQAGRDHDSALHGIYGNIGQKSNTTATRNNHTNPLKQSQQRSNAIGADDQNSSCSSSGSQYSMDDPSGLYVDGDYLSEYYIKPSIMKKVLLKYRSISDQCTTKAATTSREHYDLLVDERKAFALFEMRSRIMEKDIERQLERRGGSFAVDDIVTTPYHRTAHRIRDAIIVSKAWRDGATISDVINTALLTRRTQQSYAIPRQQQQTTAASWEMVRWLDDTDFIQYRCPSLGSRHMHGFEMFTIGDCQSILLKLTNERCNELRHELNAATSIQINAEDLMKEDESENNNADGMLTDAEMLYLSALEQVKTISKQLVAAEKSFALVRDRIRTLISRYETMLLKIEAGSYAGASSIISYESSYYSEHDHKQYMKEERVWAKRAMRAEIRAEIAAREALLAKQRASKMQAEKMREIEELRKKLDELQSENSVMSGNERERYALANVMSPQNNNQSHSTNTGKEKLDGIKQRFRDRMAEKKRQTTVANVGMSSSLMSSVNGRAPLHPSSLPYQNNGSKRHTVPPSAQHQAKRELLWSAGEEMFQQMIFYERSLEAVVVDNTTPQTM